MQYCLPLRRIMSDQYKYCGLGRGRRKTREENSSFGTGLAPIESHSMDFEDEGQNNHVECICERPKRTVFCRTCAYVGFGRLKIPCRVHPRIQMLIDMVCCPLCLSSISNMQEINNEKMTVKTNYSCTKTENDPLNPYSEDISEMKNKPLYDISELETKPLYGIGRGISPMKRSSHHYPIGSSSQTFTPGMSPLKRMGQLSNSFTRFQFPSGNEVRRPGTFREY